jgi:hypothetical protein
MLKKFAFPVLLTVLFLPLSAQVEEVSVGQSYANSTFFRIGDGTSTTVDPTTWDIAFSLAPEAAGAFVNEAVASSMGAPLPQVELYAPLDSDYDNLDTAGMIRIYNPDVTWSEGAFNALRDPQNAFDYGWGFYDEANDEIVGTEVFVIKLRSGVYKKIQITSLNGSTFNFRYANLDGSAEAEQSLNKGDFSGTLVYYSLETESTVLIEPAVWDLKFGRYTSGLDDGSGNIIQYLVTGILVNDGVEVAQADGIDPFDVDPADYENSYIDSIAVIGHDWKYFELSSFSWVLDLERVYFVKTTENELWRIFLLDFEGSSTGVTVFDRSFISGTTSLDDTYQQLEFVEVFPNPANDMVQVAMELDRVVADGAIQIVNSLGQQVFYTDLSFDAGFSVRQIPLDLPAGNYFLQVRADNEIVVRQLMIQ